MNLNFFTAEFPFKNAESFIENEIPILSNNFDKIKLFPHYFKDDKQRKLPKNIEIIQIGNFINQRISFSYKMLIILFFMIEFFRTEKKGFYLKTFRLRLSELKQAAMKSQFIESNKLLLTDSVNYSFWMNEWALVLTFLKKRNAINNFEFRICGFDIWDERREGNYMPFRNLIYKYADAVWPNAKNAANYVKKKTAFSDKVSHQYFGTKDFGFGKFNKEDEFTIISISNVIPLKRVELIIDILKNVNKKVKWVHFGAGESLETIKTYAQKELPQHEVLFMGRLEKFEDVLKYYIENTVHLFITTSSTEGMPVTIMEALSFGVPVMATNVGGIAEMISDKTGLLLEKNFDLQKAVSFIENFDHSIYNTIEKRKEIRQYWKNNFEAEKNYTEFATLLSTFG